VLTSLKMVWIPVVKLLVPVYAFSADNTTAPPVLVKVNSPGPGGAPVPRWELNTAPHGAKDKFPGPSGNPGAPDEVKFKRYIIPSLRFQAEFAQWMPNKRALPGPDGVLGDDDDQFSPEQLGALIAKAAAVGAQLRDA